jgi:hypothetical protein
MVAIVCIAEILTEIDDLVMIAPGIDSRRYARRPTVSETLDPVTRHHIDQAADRLAEEFTGIFSQETIARYMADSTDLLGEAKINVFVPVLAHRFCRERLKALAQAEGIVNNRFNPNAARSGSTKFTSSTNFTGKRT